MSLPDSRSQGVSLVGINVNFQDHLRVITDLEMVEGHAARAVDLEFHFIAVFHAVVSHVFGGHVNVSLRADNAVVEMDRAAGREDRAARRAVVIAADPQRKIDAEVDSIGIAQFHLCVISNGSEDSDIGNDSLAWSDDSDELFRGKFPLLIKNP